MERRGRGELHAVLRRMEDGIYRAEYTGELNPEDPDERAFPDSHVSTAWKVSNCGSSRWLRGWATRG